MTNYEKEIEFYKNISHKDEIFTLLSFIHLDYDVSELKNKTLEELAD